MSLTKVSYSMINGEAVNVLDYGAVGDGVTDDTTAIQSAFDSGATSIYFPPNKSFLITHVTLRSTTPVTITGYGATILLSDTTNFGLNIYGTYHKVFGLRFVPYVSVTSISQTYRGIKITTDATTTQSSFLTLRDIYMVNVYQGFLATMEDTALGRACYRHFIENCYIENYYNQKTWAGSYGISLSGVSYGDASGNDTKVIGGVIKGYEKNIIVIAGVETKFFGVGVDGGEIAFYLSSTSNIEIINCYIEYNTTVISWDATVSYAPYRTWLEGGSLANFTNLIVGSSIDGYLWGYDATGGYVAGNPLLGRIDMNTGIQSLYGTNGIALTAPKTYLGGNGISANVFLTTSAGSPEGLVTAGLGSLCSDITNGRLYVKQTGTGNTGWVQK